MALTLYLIFKIGLIYKTIQYSNSGIIKIHSGSILLNFLGLTLTHEFNFALNYAPQS